MHKVLARQLRRFLGEHPVITPEWQAFLAAVSQSYESNDEDRTLLERSLEISSKELSDINEHLKQEIEVVKSSRAQNEELEKMNRFMIGRELRMSELKQIIRDLEAEIKRLKQTTNPPANH